MPHQRKVLAIGIVLVLLAATFMVRTFGQPRRELVDGIAVEGSLEFITRTKDALRLLADNSADAYSQLTREVLTIQEFEKSGADVWSRRIQVAQKTSSYSLTWYASTLVHECRHISQYNDYLAAYPGRTVPADIYSGTDAELGCMRAQIDALQRMHAPEKEITYAKSLDGTFADLNGDGKYDEKDYRKRDW